MSKLPTMQEVKSQLIRKAIKKHKGCVTSACKEIGISRPTFYRWAEENGVAPRFIKCQKNEAASTSPAHRPASDLPAGAQ